MAIVKMRKLNLVAMSYDKDALLNALQRTNAAEVSLHSTTENTVASAYAATYPIALIAVVLVSQFVTILF